MLLKIAGRLAYTLTGRAERPTGKVLFGSTSSFASVSYSNVAPLSIFAPRPPPLPPREAIARNSFLVKLQEGEGR